MMAESPVKEARIAEKMFKLMFDTNTERRWQTESANYRSAVDHAVWAMRKAGVSVSKIAQEYGTKDRGTIYDIINRMETFVSTVTPAGDTSWLRLVSNPEAKAKAVAAGNISDEWPCWTATVQSWDDFRRPEALSALAKTDSDHYSGWLTFCVRPNNTIHIVEAEHPGSPLHKEIIAWQADSPLVQEIKTQMEAGK